jgi:catechol 2,3-dioxygenase-like lactoylglutathione lyase family enzyme
VIDHLSLGVHDLDRAAAFYARVLATVGYQLHRQSADEVALGPGDTWSFFLYPAARDQPVAGARMHIAFRADDRGTVERFYATAMELGASAVPDRHPAARPQFGDDYFGAVFTDLDGHAIEVMTRTL